MKFIVNRYNSDHGSFSPKATMGEILRADTFEHVAHSIEPLKCVPLGVYDYVMYNSPKNKCIVPLLINVPGFSMIEWHIGNYLKDTKGCLLPGLCINSNVPMVIHSAKAFERIIKLINNEPQTIEYRVLNV